jgi:hypothetical protein
MGNGLRRSILPQSVHGVYTTGTSRRVKRCKDSSRGQDRCSRNETHGIFGADGIQQAGHRAGSPESPECSRRDSGCGQPGAFADDERHNIRGARSEGHANPDLMRSRGYGIMHHGEHAERRKRESNRGKDANQPRLKTPGRFLIVKELFQGRDGRDRGLRFAVRTMDRTEDACCTG